MSAARFRRSALPRPLPEEVVELVTARLRVVAEPTRVRLLGVLNDGAATVQELADQLATTPQNVSKHLGILHQSGMVNRCREGTSVRYALVDWTGWWLVEQVGASVAERLHELHELFNWDASPTGRGPLGGGRRTPDLAGGGQIR